MNFTDHAVGQGVDSSQDPLRNQSISRASNVHLESSQRSAKNSNEEISFGVAKGLEIPENVFAFGFDRCLFGSAIIPFSVRSQDGADDSIHD